MTTYTQAQMDEVTESARKHREYMDKLGAENEAQTLKLLRSLREHVETGRKADALRVTDDLISVFSIK